MIIYTHPDNVKQLAYEINKGVKPDYIHQRLPAHPWSVDVRENSDLDRERPTGKVHHPDGGVVSKEDFLWSPDRFITHDTDSLPWLIGLGIVKEEMEMLVYVVDESRFRVFTDLGPAVMQPRAVIRNTV